MRKFYFFLYLLFFSFSFLSAQPTPAHTLGIGLQSGPVNVGYHRLFTSQVGLNLEHQRNFVSWFSLRTSINFRYFFPAKEIHDPTYITPAPTAPDQTTYQYTYNQLSLNLMPCFYYRDEKFNLFMGLSGGLGTYLITSDTFNEYLDPNNQNFYTRHEGHYKHRYLHIGYSPMAGADFKLGTKADGGEIELAFFYDKWMGREGFNYNTGFTSFAIQMSYRYNFLK